MDANRYPIYEPQFKESRMREDKARVRFAPYFFGTRQDGQESRSFGVFLYSRGRLVGHGSSAHSFLMAALVARDHLRGRLRTF